MASGEVTRQDQEFAAKYLEFGEPIIVVNQRDLSSILSSGIRPASETGKTTRAYSVSDRDEWEANIFGIHSAKPVYGAIDRSGQDGDRLSQYGYGNAVVRLRPEAMGNATATWGDSLNENAMWKDGYSAGSEKKLVEAGYVSSRPFKPNDFNDATDALAKSRFGHARNQDSQGGRIGTPEYLELQFWGGVKADQIESVEFLRNPPNKTQIRAMEKQGITWLDRSKHEDSSPFDFDDAKVLARNPDAGGKLVDAGKNDRGDQMAKAIGPDGSTSPAMLLASFLKFGTWEEV